MSANHIGNQKPFSPSNIHQPQGRPPIRSISQVYSQPRQAPVRQVSFDISPLRASEPSAKRPKLDHESSIQRLRERIQAATAKAEAQRIEPPADTGGAPTYRLPPFPSRPGSRRPRTQSPVHQYFQHREAVSSKPYILEVPKIAPKYANKQAADFFPWTGEQPEDTLNENTIKNGYFDKSITQQSETVHARNQIWSNVKQKSGLHSLSSLFVTTLQQRQKFGTAPAVSTFKPPPRATLTEPKREVWLKDLADADIPLRRLSRTIPHGIRGKILLDQCVYKRIPFERAIWLVKCVGANEIRAFKRKGPNTNTSGSETKWISEWTASVEEFVIALIESYGFPDWKENTHHGLQLVAHIYAEHLVDKAHFLSWVISSLQAAPVFGISIWLFITQMYWEEFRSCRKFGKKLAIALCQQITQLHGRVVEASQSLWDGLSAAIVRLMVAEPACFIFPDRWAPISSVLESICQDHMDLFKHVRRRNEELERFACMASLADPRQQVLDILDGPEVLLDFKKTSKECMSVCSDTEVLATAMCQWATTIYRPGFANLFLCLRLLRRWAKTDLVLEPLVFSFVRSCSDRLDLDSPKLFRLVSELVRSKHISVSRYIQWIMAQGIPMTLEKELLTCVPLHGLPDHARNLRQMVLNHPLPVASKLGDIQTTIRERLFNDAMVDEDLDFEPISALRVSEQYELTHWIRNQLFKHADDDNQLANSEDLNLICRLLEITKDYAVLADVLSLYAEAGDVVLLPIISDMMNTHFECLHAIGAAEDIYKTILERMEEVPNRSPTQKPLIQSLVDLARRLPRRSQTLMVLQKELSLCEPKSAIAACSPVSDTMGETQEDINFFEEIEILFGSGTSMDRPLLTRIFTDIVKRLETSWTDDILTSINLTEFLLRLRTFNGEVFLGLLDSWLGAVLTRRDNVKMIFAVLICGGLIDVQQLYIRLGTPSAETKEMSVSILSELLDLILETPNLPRSYHLRALISAVIQENPKILAQYLNVAVGRIGQSILAKPGIRELILRLAVHKDAVREFFPPTKPAILADLALGVPLEPAFPQQLPQVLCYFNASLCAGKLRKTLNEFTGTDLTGLSAAMVEDAKHKKDCMVDPWKQVIKHLPRQTLLDIHKSSVSSILENTSQSLASFEDSLLNLIGLVEQRLDAPDLVGTVRVLSDQLIHDRKMIFDDGNRSGTSEVATVHRVTTVLRLLAIHAKTFSQAQAIATTGPRLCLELCNLSLQPLIASETALDMAVRNTLVALSDNIPDQLREQLVHAINAKNIQNNYLQFLLGPPSQSTTDSNLELLTIPAADIAHLHDDSTSRSTGSSALCVISPDTIKNRSVTPFTLHRWEMVQDATPVMGENDTSLSLALFGARKAVL